MPCLDTPPYDVVFFLLDDMRADQLDVLEETLERLEPSAVRFDRAYVTTPMCCPERASFLSGGWLPMRSGVLTNNAPMGGATVFYDERTLATRLQSAGYTTSLIGKYLNEYDDLGAYVPPGWSRWAVTNSELGWVNFDVTVGSSTPSAPGETRIEHQPGYITAWQGAEALSVWRSAEGTPVFVYVAFHTPHNPHIPAPEDVDAFPDFLYRGGAYEEEDLSDKPAWVQEIPPLTHAEQARTDRANRQRQQALLSADRTMAALIDAVMASPRADRTLFVVSSDNGLLWREHRIEGKGVAYEESVRVPLLIAGPGVPPGQIDALVAMNLDLSATIQALAGLSPEGEGRSLVPTLCAGEDPGRDAIVLQAWDTSRGAWSAIVTATDKLIESDDGTLEYYDLVEDPYEESSLHADTERAARREELYERLAVERGLAVVHSVLPGAVLGEPYSTQLQSWGGEAPLSWTLIGEPPPGLSLSADGLLSGTPTDPGPYELLVQVQDSGRSPVYSGPQQVQAELSLRVRRCSCMDGRALFPGLFFAFWRRRSPRPGLSWRDGLPRRPAL